MTNDERAKLYREADTIMQSDDDEAKRLRLHTLPEMGIDPGEVNEALDGGGSGVDLKTPQLVAMIKIHAAREPEPVFRTANRAAIVLAEAVASDRAAGKMSDAKAELLLLDLLANVVTPKTEVETGRV